MSDERLSQLLKLKAAEKPSPDFWERFEASLERRCVQELCARPSPIQALRENLRHRKQGLAFFSLAAAGLALVVLNFSPRSPLAQGPFGPSSSWDRPNHILSREYVRDTLSSPRSVRPLSTDVLSPNPGASRYVCDRLSGHSPSLGSGLGSSATCF
jgi:hypothetical protein